MRSFVALASASLLLAGLGTVTPAASAARPAPPVAAKAAVAVTLGQAVAPTATCPGAGRTTLQTAAVAPMSYTTPFAGVITSYSYFANNVVGNVRMVFFKPGAVNGHYDVVGYHTDQPVALSQLNTFPTRIKISAGVMLGIHTSAVNMGCWTTGFAAGDVVGTTTFDPVNATDFVPVGPVPNARVDLAVTLEPDADNDGYGDVTQDACPTSDLTHDSCDRVVVPDTSFTKKPAKRSTHRKATAAFTSTVATATFECSVDQRPFKACRSPFKKRLGVGKHVLKVQAVGPTGLVDPTPAQATFKILAKARP